MNGWVRTHRTPGHDIAAWSDPDPAIPPDHSLSPRTEVALLNETTGWAWVALADGTDWWVDASLLESDPALTAPPAQTDTSPPAPEEATPASGVAGFLEGLEKPGSGAMLAVAAIVATTVTSVVLWPVLRLPGDLINNALPEGNCVGETPQTWGMYLCSARVGLMRILGGVIALAVVLAFRRPLQAQLRRVLPAGGSSLVGPVIGTALFSLVHAATHADTGDQSGFLPQRYFPAVVGLLLFAATRLGPRLANRFGNALTTRDRLPAAIRAAFAIGVPMVLAYVTMNEERVTDTARKEQLVVIATMFCGYLAFIPRDGYVAGAAARLFGGLGRMTARLRRLLSRRRTQPPSSFAGDREAEQ